MEKGLGSGKLQWLFRAGQVDQLRPGDGCDGFQERYGSYFGGWTVAMGRKAVCWMVFVLLVCTHLSSAKAGLERALWRSVFPENTGGGFQHFGLFHACPPRKRFGLFFATFKKSHCFSSGFGEPAIAVLQTLPVQQHSGVTGFLSPGASGPAAERCLASFLAAWAPSQSTSRCLGEAAACGRAGPLKWRCWCTAENHRMVCIGRDL